MFYARLVRSTRLVKSNKMLQKVAKTGWELTKVARIGRSRSVYSQKRVAGGVGQSREPKLSVCCLHISAHPFLAKNRPGAPVFGHCPIFFITSHHIPRKIGIGVGSGRQELVHRAQSPRLSLSPLFSLSRLPVIPSFVRFSVLYIYSGTYVIFHKFE